MTRSDSESAFVGHCSGRSLPDQTHSLLDPNTQVIGQTADLYDLQRILLRSANKLGDAAQQNMTRWAVFTAASLLRKHAAEHTCALRIAVPDLLDVLVEAKTCIEPHAGKITPASIIHNITRDRHAAHVLLRHCMCRSAQETRRSIERVCMCFTSRALMDAMAAGRDVAACIQAVEAA